MAIEFKASKGLTEQIAEYLGARIIHMELKPGERLLEAKLASEMGVSRAPLREALRMLEMSGLVEFMPRRGVRVSELSEKTILGIADVLKELFGLLALKGVENGTREDYETLRTIRRSLSEYAEIEDISGYINATLQFAHSACRATKNLLLERVVLFLRTFAPTPVASTLFGLSGSWRRAMRRTLLPLPSSMACFLACVMERCSPRLVVFLCLREKHCCTSLTQTKRRCSLWLGNLSGTPMFTQRS